MRFLGGFLAYFSRVSGTQSRIYFEHFYIHLSARMGRKQLVGAEPAGVNTAMFLMSFKPESMTVFLIFFPCPVPFWRFQFSRNRGENSSFILNSGYDCLLSCGQEAIRKLRLS